MHIAKFKCQSCNTQNKQEVLFEESKATICCKFCKAPIVTIENVTGCFMIISNNIGLVQIIHSPMNYKSAISKFNKDYKRKAKFKIESIFISKNAKKEQDNIKKNRKLNKYKALTQKTFYKIPIPDAIIIVSNILKRTPEWVYNMQYKIPLLPGFEQPVSVKKKRR